MFMRQIHVCVMVAILHTIHVQFGVRVRRKVEVNTAKT